MSALGSAAQAAPVSIKLNYSCNFPLMVPQPLELTINSDIPTTVPRFTLGEPFKFDATAKVSAEAAHGLRALDSATIEGTADAAATLTFPDGFVMDVAVPTDITKRDIPASGGFDTNAVGETPALNFEDLGKHELRVGDLTLNLKPRLADGGLTGLEEFQTECFLKPGQDNLLTTINVVAAGDNEIPSTPAGLNGSTTDTGATLSWSPSTDDVGVTGYEVYRDGALATTVTGTTASITGLTPGTTYNFKVRAKDASGKVSAFSTAVNLETTQTQPNAIAYKVSGTGAVKTLTKGSFPVSGAFNAKFDAAGALTADVSFSQTSARLVSLGFLPLTAKIAFLTSGATTGKLEGNVLTTKTLLRVRVPEVRLFGAIPLAGGSSCQTRNYSAVNLKSTTGFTKAEGGDLNGTFTISDLNGCGLLNGLVSPLTAGGGNTLSLRLAPSTTSAR